MGNLKTYLAETKDELINKTTWPSWAELQSSALLVLVSSIIIALLVWLMDLGFSEIMTKVYQMIN